MTRTIQIAGNTSRDVRLADFSLVESARNGEVGAGGFDVDSPGAAFDINPHVTVIVSDSDAGGSGIVWRGYGADRTIARGPFAVGSDRQFDYDLVDLNTLLGDRIIRVASGKRPAETDVQRINWLATIPAMDGLFTFNNGGTNPKAMDEADYRGRYARDVLNDCAEMAGKLFFAYYDSDFDELMVFYDLATADNYTSDLAISTVLAEVDGATVFAARDLQRRMDGGRIYSGVEVKYNGGKVFVQDQDVADTYRRREVSIFDDRIKTAAKARARGEKYLAASAAEEEVITCEVDVPSSLIADGFRTGQRVSIKAPHLGISSPVYRRLVHREVKPKGGGDNPDSQDYTIVMELSNPKTVRWSNFGTPAPENESSQGGSSLPPTTQPPLSCVTVDDFEGRTDAASWTTASGGSGTWTEAASGAGATASVGSGVGTVTLPVTTGASVTNTLDDVTGPWATNPQWTMKAVIRFNDDPPTGRNVGWTFSIRDGTGVGAERLEGGVRWSEDDADRYVFVGDENTFDSFPLEDLGPAGTILNFWWGWDGTKVWGKCWPQTGSEPDWQISYEPPEALIPDPFQYFRVGYDDATWTGANSADVLDIKWCDSITTPPACDVFDDFERTVAAGNWGTISSEPSFSWVTSGDTSYMNVQSGRGRFEPPNSAAVYNGHAKVEEAPTGPEAQPWVSSSPFTMVTRFQVTNVYSTASQYAFIGWKWVRVGTGDETWWGCQIDNASGNIYGIGGTGSPGESFTAKTDWTTGVYLAKTEFSPGVRLRFKVWLETEAEPSTWTGSVDDTGYGALEDGDAEFLTDLAGRGANTISQDYIQFCPSEQPAFGQEVQYEFVAVGDGSTTAYYTNYPYRAGTLRVFIDMLPEVNVIETNPATGAFTITGAPFNTEEIYVSYQGTGT